MRTVTAAELTRLNATHTNLYVRIEVKDSDGTYQDLTTYGGVDWFDAANWSETIDRQVQTGTIELRREADYSDWTDTDRLLDDGSFLITDASDSRVWMDTMAGPYTIAPFIQASPLNKNSVGAYAPLLELGRLGRIKTALVDHGAAPGEIDFKEMIQFRIDEIDWSANPVQMQISDIGSVVMDAEIEVENSYGTDVGDPVENQMALILSDVMGGSAPLIYTPVSPGWNIFRYKQEQKPLLSALQDLALQIGWDIRYRYDASNSFRLTFYEPDRAKVTPDATIGPTTYRDVKGLKRAIADIRNVVKIVYNGGSITRTDATSVAKYGRRFMEIANATNIDSGAEATDMGQAAVDDLSEPLADQEIETLYWWPAQLGDLYTFTANGDHYDLDENFAVVGIRHELREGQGLTTLQTRGSVAGSYRNWLRISGIAGGGGTTASDVFSGLTQTPDYAGNTITFAWIWGGDPTATFELYHEFNPLSGSSTTYTLDGASPLAAGTNFFVFSTGLTDIDAGGPNQCNAGFYLRAIVGSTVTAESVKNEAIYQRN